MIRQGAEKCEGLPWSALFWSYGELEFLEAAGSEPPSCRSLEEVQAVEAGALYPRPECPSSMPSMNVGDRRDRL